MNLIQAIAQIQIPRESSKIHDVMVIRTQDGVRRAYQVSLQSKDLFESPVFYLQQNDVVYVTPNEVRAGQSTINENYFKSGSFWISVGSIAITVTNLIITILRK